MEEQLPRRTSALMSVVLLAGFVFVIGAGIQLYFLSERTGDFFAWTISTPMAAAAIGGFYLMAAVVSGLSLRRRYWHLARVGLPGILVFLWLTAGASFAHLGTFHLDNGPFLARIAAWVWLVIYVVDPPFATFVYFRQRRAPGMDPSRGAPMSTGFRLILAATALLPLTIGFALFAAPERTSAVWAWSMAPLAARALAAWLIALGLAALTMVIEADWVRVLPMSIGFLALSVLELAAALRFGVALDGGAAQLWNAAMVTVGVIGAIGTVVGLRSSPSAS